MMFDQLSFFKQPVLSIGDITSIIQKTLESESLLQDVWVFGEISNISRPSSGHLYFTLKDASASLRCVMWRNNALRQTFMAHEGEALEVHGSIGIYAQGGQYQLYADVYRYAGEGELFQKFLRLKARLETEGLFDIQRKRPIPIWPQKIGIVTSISGAAIHDILKTIRRRYPLALVTIAATAVQGDEAPPGIINALKDLNEYFHPDVILLARGGGSIEDLWAFNDEGVARAIAASTAPVVTGIGHETDFTIADFVADQRAATPTAAAEMVTIDWRDLYAGKIGLLQRLKRYIEASLSSERSEFKYLNDRLNSHSPLGQIRSNRQKVDDLWRQLERLVQHEMEKKRMLILASYQRLLSVNPVAILDRGYAIVTKEDGQIVHSIQQVAENDPLNVKVSNGEFSVRVFE